MASPRRRDLWPCPACICITAPQAGRQAGHPPAPPALLAVLPWKLTSHSTTLIRAAAGALPAQSSSASTARCMACTHTAAGRRTQDQRRQWVSVTGQLCREQLCQGLMLRLYTVSRHGMAAAGLLGETLWPCPANSICCTLAPKNECSCLASWLLASLMARCGQALRVRMRMQKHLVPSCKP